MLQPRAEFDAEIDVLKSKLEANGLRVLMTFQCIICGTIIDDCYDMMLHKHTCRGGKPYKYLKDD